jgi:alpha-mannosidase
MAKQKVFMIGNAHLDPAWVWSWQEGSCEAKATIRSALDRIKEFPDFKFVCSSSSVYQWIEDFDAGMFEEIKARVAEGRFIIVGGWKVQPDCNLPCGENFARQSLYSQRYFKEKLGQTAKVGYNVDSFGHNAMLPQILRKSGMNHYVYMRPMEHEKSMKNNVFSWMSPDGSKVTAFRICEMYCKRFNTLEELESYLDMCSDFYGGGDFPAILNRRRKRLFTGNVFSGFKGFYRLFRMKVVGSGNDNDINVGIVDFLFSLSNTDFIFFVKRMFDHGIFLIVFIIHQT